MTEEKHGRTPSDLVASMPKWIIAAALATIAASFAYVLIWQPPRIEYFGLGFGRTGATPVAVTTGLPSSAVVAFDGECPDGWTRFEEAAARFLIGAATEEELDKGPASFRNGSNGQPLTSRPLRASDGTENVSLKIPEMPKHSHEMRGLYTREAQGSSTNRINYSNSESAGWRTSEEGEGRPHYNMPPYIALYFCKKDAG